MVALGCQMVVLCPFADVNGSDGWVFAVVAVAPVAAAAAVVEAHLREP